MLAPRETSILRRQTRKIYYKKKGGKYIQREGGLGQNPPKNKD